MSSICFRYHENLLNKQKTIITSYKEFLGICISRFYTEANITPWRILRFQNYYNSVKTGRRVKQFWRKVFLFVHIKTKDGLHLSLRQEKAILDEKQESNRRRLANVLIFVRFFVYSRQRALVSKRQAGK